MISRSARSLSYLIKTKGAALDPLPASSFSSRTLYSVTGVQREFSSFYKSFSTNVAPKVAVTRNIEAFTPVLNDFVAKYPMTSSKMETVDDLKQKSERYGFSALYKTTSNLLRESSVENAIDFYSTLIIATIQVKDTTLLHYVLEDADRYITLNADSVYEVLKRVCHFRQYSEFLFFLDTFFSSNPASRSNPQLLQMALYLCHKDDTATVEKTLRYWNELQLIPVTNDEEKHQRQMDLEHVIQVFIRCSDWARCSSLLRNECCTPRHLCLFLRGLARTMDLKRIISAYLDNSSLLYSNDSDLIQEKHYIINLMLDVAKLTKDMTLAEVIINDVLKHASEGSKDYCFPLTNTIFARMVRLSIANNLVRCVYRLYVLNNSQFKEMTKVFRSMERYMNFVDSSDPEILQMKDEVNQLHLSYPTTSEEKEKESVKEKEKVDGLVFDEDEFIEEDVLQILKEDFNIKRKSKRRNSNRRTKKKKN